MAFTRICPSLITAIRGIYRLYCAFCSGFLALAPSSEVDWTVAIRVNYIAGVELNPYESPEAPPVPVRPALQNDDTNWHALTGLFLCVVTAVVLGVVATRIGGLTPGGRHGMARLVLVTCSTIACVALIAWISGRYCRRRG